MKNKKLRILVDFVAGFSLAAAMIFIVVSVSTGLNFVLVG